jgi:V-type H+-transporting ATPase subunit C
VNDCRGGGRILYQSVSNIAFDIPIYKFQMPDLRVGTLDSLLTISDDLTKV